VQLLGNGDERFELGQGKQRYLSWMIGCTNCLGRGSMPPIMVIGTAVAKPPR
jgi:hypothetical protein